MTMGHCGSSVAQALACKEPSSPNETRARFMPLQWEHLNLGALMRPMSLCAIAMIFGLGLYSASAQNKRTPDRNTDNFKQVPAYGPRVVDLNSNVIDGGDGYATRGTGTRVAVSQGTGNRGTGDLGTGNQGTGTATTGTATTGNATTGNATTGNATTGDATSGNATTGNARTGNARTGDDESELGSASVSPDGGKDSRSGFSAAAFPGANGRNPSAGPSASKP